MIIATASSSSLVRQRNEADRAGFLPSIATTAHFGKPSARSAPIGRTRKSPFSPRGTASSTLDRQSRRSEEHTSELQSLIRISYAVFRFEQKTIYIITT